MQWLHNNSGFLGYGNGQIVWKQLWIGGIRSEFILVAMDCGWRIINRLVSLISQDSLKWHLMTWVSNGHAQAAILILPRMCTVQLTPYLSHKQSGPLHFIIMHFWKLWMFMFSIKHIVNHPKRAFTWSCVILIYSQTIRRVFELMEWWQCHKVSWMYSRYSESYK